MSTQTESKFYVRDTKAGQSIRAFIILKGSKVVGKVQVYDGTGITRVDLWDLDSGNATFQQGSARGYGYDRLTQALDGMILAGVTLRDHCVVNEAANRLYALYLKDANRADSDRNVYWADRAAKIGASFANWKDGRWHNLYIDGGLSQMTRRGFQVLEAI